MRKFEKGSEAILGGTADWDTHTFKIMLLDTATTDAGLKAVTGATNATPIVITSTAHGFATGDIVYIDTVGGNLAANGLWKITVVDANTFSLQRLDGTTNVVGSGAYTSGGYAVNMGPSAAGDNLDDFSAARAGTTTDQTLTSPTITNGVADAADPTWAAAGPNGTTAELAAIYRDTGAETTSTMILLMTGKHVVTANTQAAAAATSILVEPLVTGIPNSTVLTFSNGAAATLSAAASAGDRALTVTALAAIITVGSVALAPSSPASGLPVTFNTGNVTLNFFNGEGRIFRI